MNVLDGRAAECAVMKEPSPLQRRLAFPEGHQGLGETQQRALCVAEVPVEPANLVILTVGVLLPRWLCPISSPANSMGTP